MQNFSGIPCRQVQNQYHSVLHSSKGDIVKLFIVVFMLLKATSVYCAGVSETPVNVQEIDIKSIDDIMISYRSDNVALYRNDSDTLIIKEYMNKDNSDYYAKIRNQNNKLVIEAGRRPISLLFDTFIAHIEIYIPASDINITIKTSSGNIEGNGDYTASLINLESSSGNISVNRIAAKKAGLKASSGNIRCEAINGDGDIRTSSGRIVVGSVNGNISAESSSGSIEVNYANGKVNAKSSSGNIHCAAAESVGDISITSSSGGVSLNVPKTLAFSFSSRTSSGSLRTPFSDKLFSPVSDKKSVQGVVNGNTTTENLRDINIKTTSGSIRIDWV
jgi:hypothetical protein